MTRAHVAQARACIPLAPARLLGWLPDGTPHYMTVGELLVDGDRVCCHLCGNWFLSVASHLRVHGWTKAEYVSTFELELSDPLCGQATCDRRAAALRRRQQIDITIRNAQVEARERARSGELAAAAARANRGRVHPLQRRPKTLAALAVVRPERQRAGTARRAREQLLDIAAKAAADAGFADFAAYAHDRFAAGLSTTAISREAGLHKDWLSRHIAQVAPGVRASACRPDRCDLLWQPMLGRLGFGDVASYLRLRHLAQHRTVRAIAVEAGLSRGSVEAALRRYGIERAPHSAKRHTAQTRDREAARAMGHASLATYVASRRREGATWGELATESGVPASTLRRRGTVHNAALEPSEVLQNSASAASNPGL